MSVTQFLVSFSTWFFLFLYFLFLSLPSSPWSASLSPLPLATSHPSRSLARQPPVGLSAAGGPPAASDSLCDHLETKDASVFPSTLMPRHHLLTPPLPSPETSSKSQDCGPQLPHQRERIIVSGTSNHPGSSCRPPALLTSRPTTELRCGPATKVFSTHRDLRCC